ncbi:MAG: FAD-binding oxidoreductase [Candidatus Helarchaeota archaeon]
MTSDLLAKLVAIVGEEYVSNDPADLIPYERDDQFPFVPPHRPDFIVRPQSKEEIQAILRLANAAKIPIVPFASGINRKGLCMATPGGILLDLRRMTRIEIDPEMMVAKVEPGVNFAQLVVALKKYPHLRCLTPDAPATASVLANYMLRGIYAMATRYGIDHLISLEVVLPNGEILDTSSTSISNLGPYCNIVNGPDLTKLFQANVGTMGVATEGRIRLYPMPDVIRFLIIQFPTFKNLLPPTFEYTFRNLVEGVWIWTFTKDAFDTIMQLKSPHPEWFALGIYIAGTQEEVTLQRNEVLRIAQEHHGELFTIPPDFEQEFILDHRYMRGDVRGWRKGNLYGCSCYGSFKRLEQYYLIGKKLCEKHGFEGYHFEALPVRPFHGQLTYIDPCVLWDGGDPEQVDSIRQLHRDLKAALLQIGIYGFFRPFPAVVDSYKLGMYGELWRALKRLIDPNNIMNPGKPPLSEEG